MGNTGVKQLIGKTVNVGRHKVQLVKLLAEGSKFINQAQHNFHSQEDSPLSFSSKMQTVVLFSNIHKYTIGLIVSYSGKPFAMKRLLVQDSETFTKAQNEIDVMVTTSSSFSSNE